MTPKFNASLVAAVALMIGCARQNSQNETPNESAAISGPKTQTETTIQPAQSHFESLQALDWLVGNWVNKDENATSSSSFKWDKNKNFLIQHFVVHATGQKELDGHQIIGWDPSENKIRSWIFDSDGGFGESTWSQDGANWYASTVFTLSDGRKASTTHVYTKINDNTYTFASNDRDIDGQILPNIGPFTFIRKQERAE